MLPHRKTVIALDFDRTFTSDVEFWRMFITLAVQRGHTVVCVTGRTDCPRNHTEVAAIFGQPYFQLLSGCVFCSHSPKRAIVEARGYAIDIWVDDMPEGIGARDPAEFKALESKFPVCETLPIFNNADISPTAMWAPNAPVFPKTHKTTVN